MSMGYDKAGHMTSIDAQKGSTILVAFTYYYGSADLYFRSFDTAGNTTNYTYDTLNRIKEVSVLQGPGPTQLNDFKYSYDAPGNLTSATLGIGATPTTYTYNAANELTGSTQGSTNLTYSYDADGNLSGWTSGGLSFSYNSLNQTTAISGNNYSYSGSDQTDRVQASGTSYVYSFNGISSQTDSSGTTYYTRCNCAKGTLVDERTPSGTYYYLFDGLGSIVGLTDSNGTLVSTYQYDPYGNLTSSTGSVANPWRFAGGYFDSSTGLYKFGTRYYNPGFGRWSQQDPLRGQLSDPTSLNRYVYAGDDPVNLGIQMGSTRLHTGILFSDSV
jgi:RHS repeat-associated protein